VDAAEKTGLASGQGAGADSVQGSNELRMCKIACGSDVEPGLEGGLNGRFGSERNDSDKIVVDRPGGESRPECSLWAAVRGAAGGLGD
jgi:hypothetical protein